MTREPDPFAELDRIANEPIPRCPDCCQVEVSRQGERCTECNEEYEADWQADRRLNEEREATT